MKVYIKRGNTNYKEKRLIKELENVIEERAALDDQFMDSFQPARNFGELENMYNKYCTLDPETDQVIKDEKMASTDDIEDAEVENEPTKTEFKAPTNTGDKISDPLNRAEPEVRDYVLDDPNDQVLDGNRDNFSEPVDFKDAFSMPDETESDEPGQPAQATESKDKEKEKPINPSFDDMETPKQKRKSKRFAKTIVELVCDLAEKGFYFWVSKDINESKLAEYEASGEMDLSLLLEMPDNQQISVKRFFANQCEVAKQEKISQEDREDLTDALGEVFLEKGIAPTPTQELLLLSAKVFGVMAIKGFTMQEQNNQILTQLRDIKASQQNFEPVEETPVPDDIPEPESVPEPTATAESEIDHEYQAYEEVI